MEQLALVRKEVRRADLVRHRPAAAQPRRPMHDTMLRDRRARHTNVGHPVQAVTRKLARRRQGEPPPVRRDDVPTSLLHVTRPKQPPASLCGRRGRQIQEGVHIRRRLAVLPEDKSPRRREGCQPVGNESSNR